MNKLKKILLPLLLLNVFSLNASVSINKEGNGMPIIGELSIAVGVAYYSSCVIKIHAKNFGDMAMDGGAYGIEPTMDEFQDYEDKILDAIETTNRDKVNNITEIYANLRKHLLKTGQFNNQQQAKLDMQQRELRMEYKANLEKEIEIAKSTSFGDTAAGEAPAAGSFTYDLMKNLCKKNKMYEATQGTDARKTAVAAASKKAKKNVSKRTNISSVASEVRKQQERHYDLFCSLEEKDAGLCESVSMLPNADIMADNFLLPEGFKADNAAITNEYATRFTYNEMEALASDAFLNNIIGIMPINPPTPEERSNPKKAKFVTLYNQLLSSLNLSSYVFEHAYQNRLPKNKSGVRMSLLDTLNYMISDMNSIKSKSIEGQADSNAFEMTYQSVLALKTKLDMEKLIQKERLKLLEATTLGLMENSTSNLQNLEKKK
jgi:hypothetical protein